MINQSLAGTTGRARIRSGSCVSGDDGRTWSTIIGVVADARQQLREPVRDELYVPMFQSGQLSRTGSCTAPSSPDAMERQIRDAVHAHRSRAAGRELPHAGRRALGLPRFADLTATLLGTLRPARARHHRRRHRWSGRVLGQPADAGVRHPHGARRRAHERARAWSCARGCRLVAVGLALGVGGALVLTRVLTTLLFDVRPNDGITYLAVSIGLLLVALAACLVPARRAASVDPMVALRVG